MALDLVVFKTESTAIPKMSKKASDPAQPRVMMLSAMLLDRKRVERASICMLLRPAGWVADAKAAEVNGISQRACDNFGVRPQAAFATFMDMVRSAEEIAAFGLPFHTLMVDIELDRLGSTPDSWKRSGLKRTCIMTAAGNLANNGKTLKLEKAHDLLVETPFVPRASPIEDIRAIARVHYATIDRSF